MPNNYDAQGGNVVAPFAEAAISSSTNASPIVVTTATPHNVKTGNLVLVYDHLVNVGANGIWIAGAVTSTTVTLLGSTGVPGGVATGKVQALSLGVTYGFPADGEDVNGISVGAPFELIADQLQYLFTRIGWRINIFNGGLLTLDPKAIMSIQGRTRFRPPYRPVDANPIVVDTTMGDVVILPTPGVTPRDVQLRTSVNPPQDGERLWFQPPKNITDGAKYVLRREDATAIATIHGYTVKESGVDANGATFVECQFEGGVWRGLKAGGYAEGNLGW